MAATKLGKRKGAPKPQATRLLLAIRMAPELVEEVDEIARKETRSRANMIEILVRQALEARRAA